jgi:hypothetical protein
LSESCSGGPACRALIPLLLDVSQTYMGTDGQIVLAPPPKHTRKPAWNTPHAHWPPPALALLAPDLIYPSWSAVGHMQRNQAMVQLGVELKATLGQISPSLCLAHHQLQVIKIVEEGFIEAHNLAENNSNLIPLIDGQGQVRVLLGLYYLGSSPCVDVTR